METLSRNFITFFALFFAFCGLAHAEDTAANPKPKTEKNPIGRLRVGLEKNVLGFEYRYYEMDDGNGMIGSRNGSLLGVGVGSFWCTPPTLHVGYRLTESVVLGTRLAIRWHKDKESGTGVMDGEAFESEFESRILDVAVLPYVEYMFGDGPVRPFVTATVGYTGYRDKQSYSDTYYFKGEGNGIVAGVGGGLHVVVGRYFSLDAEVLGTYSFVHSEGETHMSGLAEEAMVASTHRVRIEGKLGISGWLGG